MHMLMTAILHCLSALVLSMSGYLLYYEKICLTASLYSPSLKPSLSSTSFPRSSIQDSILTFFCTCTQVGLMWLP